MIARSRSLKLIPVPPLTEAQSAAMMRRIAAAKKHGGASEDPDIPATVPVGAAVIHGPGRRGRPRATPEGTQQVTLRLPKQVLAYFKRGGRGWQTRAVAALTDAMEHPCKSVHK
jgi:uncharacterized protein (DUF4415 family)